MRCYFGAYYPLEEALGMLNLRQSEFFHEIQNNNIHVVCYTKLRKMLLVKKSGMENWAGLATCFYRGHMYIDQKILSLLFDKETLKINTTDIILLDKKGIIDWSDSYPFERTVPHPPITQWNPLTYKQALSDSYLIKQKLQSSLSAHEAIDQVYDSENISLYAYKAVIFPDERDPKDTPINRLLRDLEEIENADAKPQDEAEIAPNTLMLDFSSNSEIKFSDLRIPKSEIVRYKDLLIEREKSQKISALINPTTEANINTRENQLHTLIKRILQHEPKLSAKKIWQLIQNDYATDNPIFDTDFIIQAMDADAINWRSRYGNDRTFSWNSFQALTSKLKKKIR